MNNKMALEGVIKGGITLSSTYNINSPKPFDSRLVVYTKADLTKENTWVGNPVYVGLRVATLDTKEIYMCTNVNFRELSNWKKVSNTSTNWENIEGKPEFKNVATSGLYSDLTGTPTKLSDFNNDSNFITEHLDISGKLNTSVYEEDKLKFALKSEIPSITNLATKQELTNKLDTLVNKVNIKSVNGKSLLISEEDPETNIEIVGVGTNTNVVDNLLSSSPTDALSANQGKVLKEMIPTTLSKLTDDELHRLVTDSEKSEWSSKSSFDGNYVSLTSKPTLNGIEISGVKTSQDLKVLGLSGGTMTGAIDMGNQLINNLPNATTNNQPVTYKLFNDSLKDKVTTEDPRLSDARQANGGNSDTVNNHTVETNVPAEAKFTDTTYSDASQSIHGLMSANDKKKLDELPNNSTLQQNIESKVSTNTYNLDKLTFITKNDFNSDFYTGANLKTSLSNLPITKRSINVTISTDQLISLLGKLQVGLELYIRIKNSNSSRAINIAIPTLAPFYSMCGNSVEIPMNQWAEISIWCYKDNEYSIRAGGFA